MQVIPHHQKQEPSVKMPYLSQILLHSDHLFTKEEVRPALIFVLHVTNVISLNRTVAKQVCPVFKAPSCGQPATIKVFAA